MSVAGRCAAPLGGESGATLVGTLLVTVLLTALGTAALYLSQTNLMMAGNYRVQRVGEVSADGALELVKAMIYGNAPTLHLPLSVPGATTAATWHQDAAYSDADIDVGFSIRYKQEDSINYNTTESYPDEVVRYGKDYNYNAAQKSVGKQPVYSVVFSDNRTGIKAEADLVSALGFTTPAAIYVKGRVRMEKNPYANEEMIEVVSGTGTPALATTKASSGVFIQRAASLTDTSGSDWAYRDQGGNTHSFYPDYRVNSSLCVLTNPGAILSHPSPGSPYCPLTTLNTSTGAYAAPKQCWPDLYPRVYTDTEISAEIAAGRYNQAREMMHILLGVGERDADLNGSASYAASKAIFNFDVNDAAVVKYDYRLNGAVPTIEDMIGASFADLRLLADQVLTGNDTVKDYQCNNLTGGLDVSGMTFGSPAAPQLVFFNSNMNDDGSSNGHTPLSLVTTSGPVHGYGILVINGDATIYGSIDWTGLMIVRGKLVFKPWQGGTANFRSGPELMTRWNGFVMIGGDPSGSSEYGLHLWTYFGGGINLGYSTSEVAAIKGIISSTVPHKVLSWRRTYQ